MCPYANEARAQHAVLIRRVYVGQLIQQSQGESYGHHDTFAHRHRDIPSWRWLLRPQALVLRDTSKSGMLSG